MHYKNGRPAKNGDQIICLQKGQKITGILHSSSSESTTCNGRVAVTTTSDPYVTIGECLHVDDVAAAEIPDTSKP